MSSNQHIMLCCYLLLLEALEKIPDDTHQHAPEWLSVGTLGMMYVQCNVSSCMGPLHSRLGSTRSRDMCMTGISTHFQCMCFECDSIVPYITLAVAYCETVSV